MNNSNYLVINGAGAYRGNEFSVHERENKDGKPGKIVTMMDGKGDVNEVAKHYIEKEGFDANKVMINGKLATDVFGLRDNEKTASQAKAEQADAKAAKPKSKVKSLLKALASLWLPGTGQFIDGRKKDGFKDLGQFAGISLATSAVGLAGYLNFVKATQASKTPYGFYASLAACALGGIALIANRIHSVVDAYKGGK